MSVIQPNVPVIPMDFSTEEISRMLLSGRNRGVVKFGEFTIKVLAKAGQKTYILFPSLPGTVSLLFGPLELTTDFTSNLITATMIVDGDVVSGPPYEYIFVRPEDEFFLGEFFYIQRMFEGIVTNDDVTDATITLRADVLNIDQNFFRNQFYLPLARKAVQAVENLVGGAV